MRYDLEKRVVEESNFMINNNATIRETAKIFHVSKSTVHKDVAERLPLINPQLATRVHSVLDNNWADKHNRGGLATKERWKTIKDLR